MVDTQHLYLFLQNHLQDVGMHEYRVKGLEYIVKRVFHVMGA